MDVINDPQTAASMSLCLLLLMLNVDYFMKHQRHNCTEDNENMDFVRMLGRDNACKCDNSNFMRMNIHNFRLCSSLNIYHNEVMFWMKPRSTTWFSKFLMEQYDHTQWISMFRMTKPTVFALAEVIRPHVEKKDMRYRLAVLVLVKVACTLFKLSQGANFTICSEMFAVGMSTVSKLLREVIHSINEWLKQEILWPQGDRLHETQRKFVKLCSVPAVAGAIDGVHIAIAKPSDNPVDYFYFKSGGYSLNCQAVVDSDKRFLDLCVGMLDFTYDSRVLCRSSLFHLGTNESLFEPPTLVDGFSPFLIGDAGYPLLRQLMISHVETAHLSLGNAFLNWKLRKGKTMVENAFGILKQSFQELMGKSDLVLTFLPDVVVWSIILHNILLRQSHGEVEALLVVLDDEGLELGDATPPPRGAPAFEADAPAPAANAALQKRRELGLYLAARRRPYAQ